MEPNLKVNGELVRTSPKVSGTYKAQRWRAVLPIDVSRKGFKARGTVAEVNHYKTNTNGRSGNDAGYCFRRRSQVLGQAVNRKPFWDR